MFFGKSLVLQPLMISYVGLLGVMIVIMETQPGDVTQIGSITASAVVHDNQLYKVQSDRIHNSWPFTAVLLLKL